MHVCPCEGVGSPKMTDSCELLCEGWKLKLGSPEEQPVLLTEEQCLQSLAYILNCLNLFQYLTKDSKMCFIHFRD